MDYSVILMGNLYEALIKRNTLAVEFLDFLIIQNILGTINFRLKNSLEAITNYNKAIELKPDYAELYNNLRTALRHYKTKSFWSPAHMGPRCYYYYNYYYYYYYYYY